MHTQQPLDRGHQPFSRGDHLLGTLALRDMRQTLCTQLCACNSAVVRQCGNHSNKLSCHVVSTLTASIELTSLATWNFTLYNVDGKTQAVTWNRFQYVMWHTCTWFICILVVVLDKWLRSWVNLQRSLHDIDDSLFTIDYLFLMHCGIGKGWNCCSFCHLSIPKCIRKG